MDICQKTASNPPKAIEFTTRLTQWDDAAAVMLRAQQREEISSSFGPYPYIPLDAVDMPVFVVVELDDIPVAGGGLKRISSGSGEVNSSAEIKRMFVLPEHRGSKKGVSALLLAELEREALKRGWTTLNLATGVEMLAARRFYETNGYNEIPLFGDYVGRTISVAYSKKLNLDSSLSS